MDTIIIKNMSDYTIEFKDGSMILTPKSTEESQSVLFIEERRRVLYKVQGWRESCCDYNSRFSTDDTLRYIESETNDYKIIEYVFNQTEDPYYMKDGEILNHNSDDEDCR